MPAASSRRPTTPARPEGSAPPVSRSRSGSARGCSTTATGSPRKRPAELADLPLFQRDQLDPAESGGDLCVQACADDPQVAFHAIRNLTRTAHGAASLRWVQEGFLSPTTEGTGTPRNLMGFRDGTANLDPRDDDANGRQRLGAAERRRELDGRWHVPRRAQDPDPDRAVGPHRARRAGAVRRPRQGGGRADRRRRTSTTTVEVEAPRHRVAHPPRQPPHGRRQRARAHPAPRLQLRRGHRRDRADGSGALLPRLPAGPTRASSSRSRRGWPRTTSSTSTSSTRAAPSSRSRPASSPGGSIGETLFA